MQTDVGASATHTVITSHTMVGGEKYGESGVAGERSVVSLDMQLCVAPLLQE